MAVQIGFVAGTATAAVLNLADLVPTARCVAGGAVMAGAANGRPALVGGFDSAIVLRFLTGFALAGVYPPAMKMIATWFRAGRGVAIGTIVGALTVGKALLPYLLSGLEAWSVSAVVLAASAAALLAALLVIASHRVSWFSRVTSEWMPSRNAFALCNSVSWEPSTALRMVRYHFKASRSAMR
jgi:MFS family permease